MVDADRWGGTIDPHLLDAAVWATNVFAASETAIALLTSTPGDADHNVLLNPQIARRPRAGRPLRGRGSGEDPHHRAPQRRAPPSSTAWWTLTTRSGRRAGSATRSTVRRPRRRRPAAGSSTTTRSASRSSSASGPRARVVVAVHKGHRRSDPVRVGGGRVAARHRARGGGVPRRHLPRVPLRLRARPRRRGGRTSRRRRAADVARRRPPGREPGRRGHRRRAPTSTPSWGARGT